MKNIAEILSSLFQPTSETAGFSKKDAAGPSKGPSPQIGTFEDILAQMASEQSDLSDQSAPESNADALPPVQDAPSSSSAPPLRVPAANVFESLTAVSELDLQITETVRVNSLDQLEQAERTLVSLAAGLSRLLHLVSSLQSMDSRQAQDALASIGAGPVALDDAKALLNDLQTFIDKSSDGQNPLQLSPDQQNNFLNQMLRQMIQGQQVLFGVSPDPGSASNSSSVGFAGGTNVVLQMSFSDFSFAQVNSTGLQTSAVFIDVETFQMSATFIQANSTETRGRGLIPASNTSSATWVPLDLNSLSGSLDQLLSDRIQASGTTSSLPAVPQNLSNASLDPQEVMFQNFKGLVQLLIQSGVTQAALTTLMNRQKDLTVNDLKQFLAQSGSSVSLDASVGHLTDPEEIPAVSLADSIALPTSESDTSKGAISNRGLTREVFARVENSFFEASSALDRPDPVLGVDRSMVPTDLAPASQVTQPLSAGTSQGPSRNPSVDPEVNLNFKALNDMVVRLNALAPQAQSVQVENVNRTPAIEIDRLVSSLMNITPALSAAPASFVDAASDRAIDLSLPRPSVSAESRVSVVDITSVSSARMVQSAVFARQGAEPVAFMSSVDVTSVSHAQLVQAAFSGELNSPAFAQTDASNLAVPSEEQLIASFASAGRVDAPVPQTSMTGVGSRPQEMLIQPVLLSGQGSFSLTYQSVNFLNEDPLNAPLASTFDVSVSSKPVDLTAAGNVLQVNSTRVTTQEPLVPMVNVSVQHTLSPDSIAVQVDITVQMPIPAKIDMAPLGTASASAQNLVFALVTGETLKNPYSAQTPTNNTSSPQTASVLIPSVSEVKPILPQAVMPVQVSQDIPFTPFFAAGDQNNGFDNAPALQVNAGAAFNIPGLISPQNQTVIPVPLHSDRSVQVDHASILNQVTGHVSARSAEIKALSHMSFQLIPESLGRVTVQIAIVDHAISTRIIVSTPEVKEALQSHMVELKTALNQAGLQIDQLQVQVQGGSSNLLAQYFQYQQEGFGYRLPGSLAPGLAEGPNSAENTGIFENMSLRMSLVNVLA